MMKTIKHLLSKIAQKFSKKRKPIKSCLTCKYCDLVSYLQPCLHCTMCEDEEYVEWKPNEDDNNKNNTRIC